jgi:hypothetical protein
MGNFKNTTHECKTYSSTARNRGTWYPVPPHYVRHPQYRNINAVPAGPTAREILKARTLYRKKCVPYNAVHVPYNGKVRTLYLEGPNFRYIYTTPKICVPYNLESTYPIAEKCVPYNAKSKYPIVIITPSYLTLSINFILLPLYSYLFHLL